MENTDIKELLMKEARDNGICIDGYNDMRNLDRDGLVDYYIKHPDWCMEREFPGLKTLEDHFRDCQDKGIYIGKTFCGNVLNGLQSYMFHGCKGSVNTRLNIQDRIIPMFYFANGCEMLIHCDERIKIPLYIFGHNRIKTSGKASFRIHRFQLKEKGGE